MSQFRSFILVNPTAHEISHAIISFEEESNPTAKLHDVAVVNLNETTFDLTDPFPRLENHGSYLFGEFATPTSLIDGADLYISVHFVISFTHVVLVVRTPSDDMFTNETNLMVQKMVDICTSSRGEGWFVTDLLRCIVKDLESKVLEVSQQVDFDLALITQSFDYRTKNLTNHQSSDLYLSATRHRVDILGCKTTVEETTRILQEIAGDRLDLKPDDGTNREFFSRELELYVEDLHIRLRRLTALRANLEATLKLTFDKFEKIDDQSQTRASHNMTAIASIMLLPSFLVGFFGQNFRIYGGIEYEWGWALSIAAILIVTGLQVAYFKRKRWL